MKKSDLIAAIADKKNPTEKKATDLVFDEFKNTLGKGGSTEVRGFGSFSVRKYRLIKEEIYAQGIL
ncbi:MAG: HU family DNA-binding protein [Smithella sp.]|jgi:nucleoid DNA-binding protein